MTDISAIGPKELNQQVHHDAIVNYIIDCFSF